MSKKTIRVVARVIALPEKVEEVKQILIELVEKTRKEAGCIQYDLLRNQSYPTDFTFVEEWESNAALEVHLASVHIEKASEQLEGLVAAEPDIRLYTLLA